MRVTVLNANIRGCEVRESKTTGKQYLLVRYEDETGAPEQVVDHNTEHQSLYRRNTEGTLYLEIVTGRSKGGNSYASISIIDFKCALQ